MEPTAHHPPRLAHLHCLYCGGERRGDDSACRACGAEAPSVPCRRCAAAVFAPRKECICGETCDAWAVAQPAEPACPRCGGKLAWVNVEGAGAYIEQCVRCLGCFVRTQDWSALAERESALAERESAHDPIDLRAFVPPPDAKPLPSQSLLAEVRCPRCRRPMDRTRFAQRAALVVDVCPTCGIWLDAGELPAVLEHVSKAAGGQVVMDEADRTEQAYWDHVQAQQAVLHQSVSQHMQNIAQMERSRRTGQVILGTAVGGPWVGLFLAMRNRGKM